MARASYSTTPLLRSLVHRPQGVILVGIVAKRQVGMHSIRDSDGIVVLKMFIVTYLGTLN